MVSNGDLVPLYDNPLILVNGPSISPFSLFDKVLT